MPIQAATVALDGGGGGIIRLSPAPVMRYWVYSRVSISINTGLVSAETSGECFMYKGEPNAANFITSSRTPWADTAGFDPQSGKLTSPEYFTFVFVNCDPLGDATVVADFMEQPFGL